MPANDDEIIAILTSDWHVWHSPPIARSVEPDWFKAMQRPFDEIKRLQNKHKCPVVVAGDIFHHHDPTPEAINWLINNIPENLYGVAGQHDLPNHRLDDIGDTGYWTLVEAGKLKHLKNNEPVKLKGLRLWGFNWGEEPKPCPSGSIIPFGINVAVLHRYCWKPGACYVGASEKDHVSALRAKLRGFHVAVFGDNHIGHLSVSKQGTLPVILNCGGMMRRRQDEKTYRPAVGLLRAGGNVSRIYLDTSQDLFLESQEPEPPEVCDNPELNAYLHGLEELGDRSLDFAEELRRAAQAETVTVGARKLIEQWLSPNKH